MAELKAAQRELYEVRLVLKRTSVRWRRGMALHSIVWGLGYLFGPAQWSSSGSLDVIRDVGIPFTVHGLVILAVGLLILTRWREQAHRVAFVFWAVWTVGLMLAVPTGSIVAWGGWLHAAVVCAVGVADDIVQLDAVTKQIGRAHV